MTVELEAHAGFVVVRSADAGPAGTAGLLMGQGLDLDIDVAVPTTLVGLRADLSWNHPGGVGHAPRPLDALVGADRADALRELIRASGRGTPPGGHHRLDTDCARDARFAGEGSPRHSHRGVVPALHRAALAYAATSEAGAPPIVRAVGRLEAAVELIRAPYLLGLGSMVRRDARLATEMLLDLAERSHLAVPDSAASNLAALLRTAIDSLGGRRAEAMALLARASEIERGDHTMASAPEAEASTRRSMADPGTTTDRDAAHIVGLASRRRVRVDVRALPGGLADDPPVARRAGVSEVEVRIPAGAERRHDLWARAFQTRHDVLLAAAPFRREDGDAVARLLLSPHDMRNVEVDVTDRPELPRPSAVLCAVQRAIHHGRLAARAERLGQSLQAADRWRQCAREWTTAGDEDRAEEAARYGRGQSTDPWPLGRVIAPLVSDLL